MTNYKKYLAETIGEGITHPLQPGERIVTLYGDGTGIDTTSATLHLPDTSHYRVPVERNYFPVAILLMIDVSAGVRTITLEYSDDTDASTNAVTLAVFHVPINTLGNPIFWMPVHANFAPTLKYINIKSNVSNGSPDILCLLGYDSAVNTHEHPDLVTS